MFIYVNVRTCSSQKYERKEEFMFVDDNIINNGKGTFYGHHRHTR